jgi:hypothetical protein
MPHKNPTNGFLQEILEVSKLFRNPIAIGFSESGGMAESGLL